MFFGGYEQVLTILFSAKPKSLVLDIHDFLIHHVCAQLNGHVHVFFTSDHLFKTSMEGSAIVFLWTISSSCAYMVLLLILGQVKGTFF